jgi:histidinol-phosphate aminotransferase
MISRTPVAPRVLFDEMLARDILIRDVSRYPMLSDYFRVSAGSPEENDRLLAALKEVLAR